MKESLANALGPDLLTEGKWESGVLQSCLVSVGGQDLAVQMEADMWAALFEICVRERCTVNHIFTSLARARPEAAHLPSIARGFIINYFRGAATEDGHHSAGHGAGSDDRLVFLH